MISLNYHHFSQSSFHHHSTSFQYHFHQASYRDKSNTLLFFSLDSSSSSSSPFGEFSTDLLLLLSPSLSLLWFHKLWRKLWLWRVRDRENMLLIRAFSYWLFSVSFFSLGSTWFASLSLRLSSLVSTSVVRPPSLCYPLVCSTFAMRFAQWWLRASVEPEMLVVFHRGLQTQSILVRGSLLHC